MYVCAGGRAKANRQASSIEELRQSLATTRSHLEDIAAVEGGNEAQSQGEGVAEFRALQEQQRVLRKTYDDLRGAVMGTANAAARGRARAEAKLSDVLESSRRVRAAYMKGSPMFESLLAEREKLKAELSRCSDKIAEIVRDAGDQNKEQTEYQREMRERTLILEDKIGAAQARVEKTMLEVRERSEQSLQLEASRQARGISANDATLQLRSQLATETARVRAARLEKAAQASAHDLSVLSVSAMHEAANENAAAEQIEAVVISPSSSDGNTTVHHAIAREIAVLSSMKVRGALHLSLIYVLRLTMVHARLVAQVRESEVRLRESVFLRQPFSVDASVILPDTSSSESRW